MERATDVSNAFRTYANYIEAFATLADVIHRPEMYMQGFSLGVITEERITEGLLRSLRSTRSYRSIEPRAPRDVTPLRQSLTNAWGTELALAVVHESVPDETLSVSAQWAVVQAYYAAYQATRAVAIATRNEGVLHTHPSIQNFFQNFWCNRIRVAPLNFAFSARGEVNAPEAYVRRRIHNLSTVSEFNAAAFVFLALRTTFARAGREAEHHARIEKTRQRARERAPQDAAQQRFEEASRKQARRSGRTKLTPAEKQGLLDKQRPATLMDFLFRLRIGANYEDATIYLDGPATTLNAWSFLNHLRMVIATIVAASEAVVRSSVGPTVFDPIASEWATARLNAVSNGTLVKRAALLLE